MPRTCTVCTHPERGAIDADLVAGESAPKIAAKYRISEDSVTRHRANHLPTTLARAQGAAEVARGDAYGKPENTR